MKNKEVISNFKNEKSIYLHCNCGCGILVITQVKDEFETPEGKGYHIYYDLTYYSHFKVKKKIGRKFDWTLVLSQEQIKLLATALTNMTKKIDNNFIQVVKDDDICVSEYVETKTASEDDKWTPIDNNWYDIKCTKKNKYNIETGDGFKFTDLSSKNMFELMTFLEYIAIPNNIGG